MKNSFYIRSLSAMVAAIMLTSMFFTAPTIAANNSKPAAAAQNKTAPKTTAKPVAKTSGKATAKPAAKAAPVKPASAAKAQVIDPAALEKKLIVLPKGEFDSKEAAVMAGRIMKIEHKVLQSFVNKGGKLKLITTNITGDPAFAHLKNKTPRGWEETGLTWDDVPGIGGKTTLAKIGASDRGNGHGSICLELHELAHGLDQYVFGDVSQGKTFAKMAAQDKELFAGDPYFQYSEEFFAEAFAMYYYSDDTRKSVKEKAPNVYALIQKLISK